MVFLKETGKNRCAEKLGRSYLINASLKRLLSIFFMGGGVRKFNAWKGVCRARRLGGNGNELIEEDGKNENRFKN